MKPRAPPAIRFLNKPLTPLALINDQVRIFVYLLTLSEKPWASPPYMQQITGNTGAMSLLWTHHLLVLEPKHCPSIRKFLHWFSLTPLLSNNLKPLKRRKFENKHMWDLITQPDWVNESCCWITISLLTSAVLIGIAHFREKQQKTEKKR